MSPTASPVTAAPSPAPSTAPTLTPTTAPTCTPTAAPSIILTRAPTRSPSTTLTAAPSAAPTVPPLYDCRSGCTLAAGTSIAITGSNAALRIRFPTYFSLSFEVMGLSLAAGAGSTKNIIDIYFPGTFYSVLKVSATDTRALEFSYFGQLVVDYGSLLVPTYQTVYTTVAVFVEPLELYTTTSADYNTVYNYSIAADTFDPAQIYTLYASGVDMVSATGTLRNIIITRKYAIRNQQAAVFVCVTCTILYLRCVVCTHSHHDCPVVGAVCKAHYCALSEAVRQAQCIHFHCAHRHSYGGSARVQLYGEVRN